MEVLLLLFFLLLFWLFISWDKDRMGRQATMAVRGKTKGAGFSPRALISTPALFVAAVALIGTALVLAIRPPVPPFKGRSSLITKLLYAAFGPYGPALAATALAFICLAAALACIRKKFAELPSEASHPKT